MTAVKAFFSPSGAKVKIKALPRFPVTAMQDLVDDTSPQLGGDLDVNGQSIFSAGSIVVQVGDAAGTYKLSLQNINGTEVFAVDSAGALTLSGTVDGRDVAADGTKLDTIETGADVTDTANVTAAGALMLTGGNLSGNITVDAGVTIDGRDLSVDGAKLDLLTVTGAVDLDALDAAAVRKSLFDANTILAANSDDTPAALTVGEQTLLGRITGGNIAALTQAQIRTLLNVEDGAAADMSAAEILTAIKTVDGAASGLDADLLDGQEGSYYTDADNAVVDATPSNYSAATGDVEAHLAGIDTALGSAGGGGLSFECPFRLTLTSGTPVLTSDVTAATTVYAALMHGKGNKIALYTGSAWTMVTVSEMSLSMSGWTASKNSDIFIDYNGGTPQLTRVEWTNGTTRATALTTQDGIHVLTGDAQQRYLGTIRTSATGQTQVKFGTAAAGGGEAWFGLWNLYNRIVAPFNVRDTTDSWTYSTQSWRSLDNSTGNRASFVRGLDIDMEMANIICPASHSVGANAGIGIGLDNTSANSAQVLGTGTFSSTFLIPWNSVYRGFAGLGWHYLQALEIAASSGTTTYYGDAGTTFIQSGLTGEHWY